MNKYISVGREAQFPPRASRARRRDIDHAEVRARSSTMLLRTGLQNEDAYDRTRCSKLLNESDAGSESEKNLHTNEFMIDRKNLL